MSSLSLEYTANAGGILQVGEIGFGIDLFPCEPGGIYPDLSSRQLSALLGRIAGGEIRALLFTHHHPDHVYLPYVCEALSTAERAGKYLSVITTAQLGEALLQSGIPENRLWIIPPVPAGEAPAGALQKVDLQRLGIISDCSLRAAYVLHDGAGYEDVENLLFLIRAGEKRLAFPGDAKPDDALFALIGAWSGEIDWLVAPFPYFGKRSVRRRISAHLRLRNAALWHFPIPEKDVHRWREAALHTCAGAGDGLVEPVYLQTPGETISL